MKISRKQLEKIVRKVVLESINEMDLGKRQTNLPQASAGTVPRPQKGGGKIAGLNKTVMNMPKEDAYDLDTNAILEDALDEDLGMAGEVATGIIYAVAGLSAINYGIPLAFRIFGNVLDKWVKGVDKENLKKVRQARDEKLRSQIKEIASKFENDTELSQMLSELDKVPYNPDARTKKDKIAQNMRSRLLRDINSHVKSKLSRDELRFVTVLNKFLRGEGFNRAKV